ncbi:MAG: anaerobic glycerol-3-phosphate dehydrogenase subunit C [Thermoguttaceae bacterium]
MPQLDQLRERIQADLRGRIAGDVRCDDVFLQLYSGDASIYQVRPLGVVRPRSVDDVSACLEYASNKGIPVHTRGGGTGTAGGALGRGLVLDCSRYLRRIVHVDDRMVRVQSGIVHERLNAFLKRSGRTFGPDPGISETTTIGSMLAVDGAGSHWLRYGCPSHHILGLQVVLADGQVLEIGREPLDDGEASGAHQRKREIVRDLSRLIRENETVIRENRPRTLVNRAGYRLWDAMDQSTLNLAALIAGSEGTLAVITEARLATQPLAASRGAALLMFPSLDSAVRAALLVRDYGASACELMDRRHLSLARELDDRFESLVPENTEAALLVELDGDDRHEVGERLRKMTDDLWDRRRLAFGARRAMDRQEFELCWALARKVRPTWYRMKGAVRPVPVIDDLAVAPEMLPDFVVRVQNVLKRLEVTASIVGHAAQGQLIIRPFLDLASSDGPQQVRRLADGLYEEVVAAGGTIGAERGSGLSRSWYLQAQFGPLYQTLRQVKEVFDPKGILNPGKVVDAAPDDVQRDLRRTVSAGMSAQAGGGEQAGLRDLLELQLNWDPAQVTDAVALCNTCGDCRSQGPGGRMCPLYRMNPSEEASPRAKANLIHAVLTGGLELESLTGDAFKSIADLCIHCHICPTECPAGVDIPKLMVEGKGAYVAAHGLKLSDWITARLDLVSALASKVSPLANWALANRRCRWLIEKCFGISQGRKLPRVSSRNFLRRAARRRLVRPTRSSERKVAYFVDLYANYHDPQLAEAAVAVLKHNGVAVFVPPGQKQAGMAAIADGALDIARRFARSNVAILAEAVRQGYHVIATEPAAAVCLRREYPQLLDDEDARLVAENSSEICSYLWKMHTVGKLHLDFNPVNFSLGYHMPCRMKALNVGSPGENLLRLIPGLSLHRCEEGCSGMAGTYGIKSANYRASLRMARGLLHRMREDDFQAGTTECSACKMQMEQGTTKPTVHPIKVLALAYGLMPQIRDLLTKRGKDLVVT